MPKIKSENVRKDYVFNQDDYLYKGKYNREKLIADARRVAKATNQRLLRLERAGLTNAPAYKGAEKVLLGVNRKDGAPAFATKSGKVRYQESAKQLEKLTTNQLKEMLKELGRTQTAKTSTVAGVKNYTDKVKEHIAKDIAPQFEGISTDDVIAIFEDAALSSAIKNFGYKFVIQQIKDIEELLLEYQEDVYDGIVDVSDEEYEGETAARAFLRIVEKTEQNAKKNKTVYNLSTIEEAIDRYLGRKPRDTSEWPQNL